MEKTKWVRGNDAVAVVGDYLITTYRWSFIGNGLEFLWFVFPLSNIWAAPVESGKCGTETGAMRCATKAARRLMAEKAEVPE